MRLTKEERYQLKLIRLAKEVCRRTDLCASYEYEPTYMRTHRFKVYDARINDYIIYTLGSYTSEAIYKWAVEQCRKKGLIK